MIFKNIILIVLSCHFSMLQAQQNENYIECVNDDAKYNARSQELQKIVNEDQQDRTNNALEPGAVFRDRERRMRVGEIFGEGCFKVADDFSNAALVYQHGTQPDHYWQAFTWSQRAFELGKQSSKRMMALTIDRYLISKGHKQLFGTQAVKSFDSPCWCMQPIEVSFTKEMRQDYLQKTLNEQLEWVASLNQGATCPTNQFCSTVLKDSPIGTVIGFW